jgi:hypothetical protein
MAVNADGHGYWLVGANGSVFNLGNADWYGSLASRTLGFGQRIIAMQATSDGRGYWLIDESGTVYNFGDASPINAGESLPSGDLATPIVSAAVAPGGAGAWFVDSIGHLYTSGTAPWYGSRAFKQSNPITSIAPTPSGLGYWVSDAAGEAWGFGDAVAGALAPVGLRGAAISMTAAQNSLGYWVATSSGSIIDGGDATTRPGTPAQENVVAVVGIAPARQVEPTPLPSGTIGYDINWPQCASSGSSQAGPLPGPPDDAAASLPYSIAVVGVDGWAVDDVNPCLAPEAAWAARAVYPAGSAGTGAPPYDLYMFLNSPAADSTIDQNGPAGRCAELSGSAAETCLAYNYGYNAAVTAVGYATSQGARSNIWWLDIENDSCAPGMWNDAAHGEWWSCDTWLNADTIQGALNALRSLDITPGIYCTAFQWDGITGAYIATGGAPLIWVAGATWTSPPYPHSYGFVGPGVNTKYCTESQYWFAGGRPTMLQETPGDGNNYAFDPNIAC